jgi:hypothetical protein
VSFGSAVYEFTGESVIDQVAAALDASGYTSNIVAQVVSSPSNTLVSTVGAKLCGGQRAAMTHAASASGQPLAPGHGSECR